MLADQAMHSVAFSSDGSLIAVGTGGCVTLWNSGDGSFVASLAGAVSLEDASFPLLAFIPVTPYLAGNTLLSVRLFCSEQAFHYFFEEIFCRGSICPVLPSKAGLFILHLTFISSHKLHSASVKERCHTQDLHPRQG